MSLMVSISGVRGIVGESLTPDVVVQYASAFAEFCGRGTIVLGRDGRITGKIITHLTSSTLLAAGCDVIAIGICPTPTVQLAVEQSGAVGGVVVTASHNPMQWNGMKFIGNRGMFLDAAENQKLWDIAARNKGQFARWEKLGKHIADNSFLQKHITTVLSLPYINPESIKQRKFKVVVDCINASGGMIVPRLLKQLGCSVVEMNCEVSGVFSRNPEPVPENLTAVCKRVREEKAHLGIAVDPDVDRLVLITEKGEPLGEEYTIVSLVKFILEKERMRNPGSQNSVVVNLSTTRAVDDVAKQCNAKVVRTPVGEINVAKKMKEIGAVIGGEGSGGVILPAAHYGRDAAVGIGLIMQMLAEFGGTLSQWKAMLPQYVIVKQSVVLGDKQPDTVLHTVREKVDGKGTINTDDGLKIDFPDAWVHLRKSNTEPIIRIIAEAPSQSQAEALARQFQQHIRAS